MVIDCRAFERSIPPVQLNYNLAGAMIVYFFEFSNVAFIEASACCDRLNVVHQSIRERVRSSHRIKFIGHLKGSGRRG